MSSLPLERIDEDARGEDNSEEDDDNGGGGRNSVSVGIASTPTEQWMSPVHMDQLEFIAQWYSHGANSDLASFPDEAKVPEVDETYWDDDYNSPAMYKPFWLDDDDDDNKEGESKRPPAAPIATENHSEGSVGTDGHTLKGCDFVDDEESSRGRVDGGASPSSELDVSVDENSWSDCYFSSPERNQFEMAGELLNDFPTPLGDLSNSNSDPSIIVTVDKENQVDNVCSKYDSGAEKTNQVAD
jgi:hypothetical protein